MNEHKAAETSPLVRQFSKQIAGHAAEKGSSKPGMMKHADGGLLKPILAAPRGPRELSFYTRVFNSGDGDDQIVRDLRSLLPQFRGVFKLRETDEQEFLKLEDLTAKYQHPCILDVKMGKRTFDPEASEAKIRREEAKYLHTKAIGFCIPGMRVYQVKTQQYIYKDRNYGKQLNEKTVRHAFELYLNSDTGCSMPIIQSFLQQLHKVRAWFLQQTRFHFFASSLLLIYDADTLLSTPDGNIKPSIPSGESLQVEGDAVPLTDVRMIDFAHVFESTERDENYLHGLNSLIQIFEELLTTADIK